MRCVGSLVCLCCFLDLFGPFGLCVLSCLHFVLNYLDGFLSVSIVLIIWIVSAVSFFGLLEMFFTFLYKYDLDAFVESFLIVFLHFFLVFWGSFLGFFGSQGSLGGHFGKLFGSQGALGTPFWLQK